MSGRLQPESRAGLLRKIDNLGKIIDSTREESNELFDEKVKLMATVRGLMDYISIKESEQS